MTKTTTAPAEQTELKSFYIDRVNTTGFGEAHLDTQDLKSTSNLVEIPFTHAGEEVLAELYYLKRKIKRGEPKVIKKASPHRSEPQCPHYGTCGGCRLQHFDATSYEAFKRNLLKDAFAEHNLTVPQEIPITFVGAGARRRIDFMARYVGDEICMGFHEMRSKRPFNTRSCPLLTPKLEALFAPLRDLMPALLRQEKLVHIFATDTLSGIDLLLAGFKEPLTPDDQNRLTQFAQEHHLARLTLKVKKRAHVLFEAAQPVVQFGQHKIPVDPFSFLQSTAQSDQIFATFLKKQFSDLPKGAPIADLFCGRGTLSLPLYDLGFKVEGYETDRHALKALGSLGLSSSSNPFEDTRTSNTLNAQERNLFEDPLNAQELSQFAGAVMNPPRAGAQAQTEMIAKSSLKRLVYISCGPSGFARDLKVLLEAGFELEALELLDQFHWSPHLEVMAALKRA